MKPINAWAIKAYAGLYPIQETPFLIGGSSPRMFSSRREAREYAKILNGTVVKVEITIQEGKW